MDEHLVRDRLASDCEQTGNQAHANRAQGDEDEHDADRQAHREPACRLFQDGFRRVGGVVIHRHVTACRVALQRRLGLGLAAERLLEAKGDLVVVVGVPTHLVSVADIRAVRIRDIAVGIGARGAADAGIRHLPLHRGPALAGVRLLPGLVGPVEQERPNAAEDQEEKASAKDTEDGSKCRLHVRLRLGLL